MNYDVMMSFCKMTWQALATLLAQTPVVYENPFNCYCTIFFNFNEKSKPCLKLCLTVSLKSQTVTYCLLPGHFYWVQTVTLGSN